MDLGIVAAALMLVGWAAATVLLNPAPGWVHAFLTLGAFLLVWRIAARGEAGKKSSGPGAGKTKG